MRTAGPAAGLSLSIPKIPDHPLNVRCPCFSFLDDRHPANPLVALNGSKLVPFFNDGVVRCKRFLHVVRQFVQDAAGNLAGSDVFLLFAFIHQSGIFKGNCRQNFRTFAFSRCFIASAQDGRVSVSIVIVLISFASTLLLFIAFE